LSYLKIMTNHFFRSPSNARLLAASIFLLSLTATSLLVISIVSAPAFAQAANKPRAVDSLPITIEATEFLEWNQTEGTYIAKGNAFVQQNQASIKAEHIIARYITGSETRDITRVIATGAVTYIEGENTASGDKLDYNLNANIYVLTGIKSSVESPRGIMTATESITHDATDGSNRKVTATGNARYKNDDGRTVFGDKLIAHIEVDGTLKNINAYGNTKVTTNNGTTATADRLNYVAITSLANLDGNVEIISEENVMRGAKAKIDFKNEISRIISVPGGERVSGTLTP
jgi:lipopolysaccharide export system protein LptA